MRTSEETKQEGNSILKEYYALYLKRGRLSDSSVKHYLDGLKNISRRLVEKGLVKKDIYEIDKLETLHAIREILNDDPDYVAMNNRGNHMYSVALNHYCKFAEGELFRESLQVLETMDVPMPKSEIIISETASWNRSDILRIQAKEMAEYKCEIDSTHLSFKQEGNNKPYMESHHAIPLHYQDFFQHSLDVYSNLICMCPICHRKIHFGLKQDRIEMAQQLYEMRGNRLANCGLLLSKSEFIEKAAK